MGFRVQGFGVQGSGFRVQGSGFRAQGSGFRVSGFQGSGFRVQGSGFRVKGKGLRITLNPKLLNPLRFLGLVAQGCSQVAPIKVVSCTVHNVPSLAFTVNPKL